MNDEEQLDLFEDYQPDFIDPFEDFLADEDYELNVTFGFQRREGDLVTSTFVDVEGDGDYLPVVLAAMTTFLNELGFTYVTGVVAQTAHGREVAPL